MPPPPLLSRDPGALRLITFPDTTWPSAAARRSASRRPNRPPPTLRSGPGLRRKPSSSRRRRRRRAGEADGRSGFRLSPQRRTRRRECRGAREAEEGEATSLPGPSAARDARAQEEEEDSEEEAAGWHHSREPSRTGRPECDPSRTGWPEAEPSAAGRSRARPQGLSGDGAWARPRRSHGGRGDRCGRRRASRRLPDQGQLAAG